jgi:hypothetical protein
MIDMVKLFEEFEKEDERRNQPRDQVRRLVSRYSYASELSHSLIWRSLYLKLEAKTGFRVPEDARCRLKLIEDAGYIQDLLELAKKLD